MRSKIDELEVIRTETPEDIAAIMSWLHENPKYLSPETVEGGWSEAAVGPNDKQVLVSSLLDPTTKHDAPQGSTDAPGVASWRRFMAQIMACFREPRGPISANSDPDEGTPPEGPTDRPDGPPPPPAEDPNVKRALRHFDQLFEAMLNAPPKKRDLPLAFRMTQYVCDRLEPDTACVKTYLDRLVASFVENPPDDDGRDIACVAILISLAASTTTVPSGAARLARRRLRRVGADLGGLVPDMVVAQGFVRSLVPDIDAKKLWDSVREVRTAQEEVRAYRTAGGRSISKADFPFLSSTPEWPTLAGRNRKAISFLSRLQNYCPIHFKALPLAEAARLRENAVCRAGCCERILLCDEI